jgi:hypothetical protein
MQASTPLAAQDALDEESRAPQRVVSRLQVKVWSALAGGHRGVMPAPPVEGYGAEGHTSGVENSQN